MPQTTFTDLYPSTLSTLEICERMLERSEQYGEEAFHFVCGAVYVVKAGLRWALSEESARHLLEQVFECQGLGEPL